MARRFWDGFDNYTGTVGSRPLDNGWIDDSGGGSFSMTSSQTRFGTGQAILLNDTNGEWSAIHRYQDDTTEYFKFAVAHKDGGTPEGNAFMGVSATNALSGSHIGLSIESDYSLCLKKYLGTSSSSFAILGQTAPGFVTNSSYHHYAMGGRIHDSLGSVQVAIDGVVNPDLSVSGVDTRNSASIAAKYLWIGIYGPQSGGAYTNNWFDDFYMDDATDELAPPERRVIQLVPNGDGGTLLLVPSTGVNHYAVVDESTVDPADYLSGTAVGDLDLLELTTLTYVPAAIDGVILKVNAAKTDATVRAIDAGVKSGAVVVSSPDRNLSTTPGFHTSDPLLVDPATTAPWTKSGIDSLLARPRIAV